MTDDVTRILLAIEDNTGYTPDQVQNTVTVRDLMRALQEAADQYGEDTLIVLDNGQRYGAQFGGIDIYRDLITPVEADDDE
ncbi:hypothetical protein [Microbacterium sp. CIAB417]|uniref:hypothetical protein n=1 Tax=Microbacterium sp. CIAB417 TaxID=2860287 RepID=UPI001FADE5C1|nr:hypothetical protein [Microbacterium sp. CIAB417]